MNKVIVMGRLTANVESNEIGSITLAKFNIANNRNSKNKGEEVSFFECVAWGKLGEIIAQYFTKGSRILIEGRIEQQRWETDGNKRSKIVIVVDGFDFIDSKKSEQDNPF